MANLILPARWGKSDSTVLSVTGFLMMISPVVFWWWQMARLFPVGAYNGEELNWDIRASEDQWKKWIAKPPGMMGLGVAFTSGKMKFKVGDYGAMLKEPKMAKPFIKSFSVMGKV